LDKTNFYLYRYIRLDINTPFYIGKGKGPRAKNIKWHNQWCQNIANKYGCKVEYMILNLTENEAFIKEKEFIKFYRNLGYKLTNLTDGGEGVSGYKHTEKTIAQKIGKNNPMYGKVGPLHHNFGKKMPPEIVKIVSQKNTGKKHSEESKNKISIGLTGRKCSKETRNKLSIAHSGENSPNFGKSLPEETKAKISASLTGIIRSDEFKAKVSASKKGKTNSLGKKVIDIITKVVWCSIREAAVKNNIPQGTLFGYLNNPDKNKTNLRFLDESSRIR